MSERKIQGFKKFSEIKSSDGGVSDIPVTGDIKLPMNPNLPIESTKTTKTISQEGILPIDKNGDEDIIADIIVEDVKFIGKLAKFPNRTKASKALNFLENVKISKNSIWYILVEKQENELQMLKYNNKQGFDMSQFVLELKGFYLRKWSDDKKLTKLIESIDVFGAKEFSTIKNIPNIEVEDGKKLISKITEDLIKLLSK